MTATLLGGRAYANGVKDLSPGLRRSRYPGAWEMQKPVTPSGLLSGRDVFQNLPINLVQARLQGFEFADFFLSPMQ